MPASSKAAPLSPIAGYGHLREHFLDHTPLLLPLVTRLVVGSVPDGVAETSSPEWDRRLELPFTLEGAAA